MRLERTVGSVSGRWVPTTPRTSSSLVTTSSKEPKLRSRSWVPNTRLEERAQAGEITAVAVTGRAPYLAAGADLTAALTITSSEEARALGRAGHDALRLLGEMSVPTFAFINGLALGGGLEIALNCSYRTIAADVRAVGLPEISLGLIPGWGGTYLLPRIIGLDSALEMILTRAAANKPYPAAEAYSVGIADAIFDPEHFLIQSLEWASAIVRRELQVERGAGGFLVAVPVWPTPTHGTRCLPTHGRCSTRPSSERARRPIVPSTSSRSARTPNATPRSPPKTTRWPSSSCPMSSARVSMRLRL